MGAEEGERGVCGGEGAGGAAEVRAREGCGGGGGGGAQGADGKRHSERWASNVRLRWTRW